MTVVLDRKRLLHRIVGRCRLIRSFCPRCNSDAPAVYNCCVCRQLYVDGSTVIEVNRRQCYPVNLSTKALWWYTWMHPNFESMQCEWEVMIQQGLPTGQVPRLVSIDGGLDSKMCMSDFVNWSQVAEKAFEEHLKYLQGVGHTTRERDQ